MDFFVFILVNFTLFVRPGEIFPDLADIPIYLIFIVLNMAIAFPSLVDHLRLDRVSREPITACVLALIPAVFLSHISHFNLYDARMGALDFSKTIAYYVLLVSVINSTQRLRVLLQVIAVFAAISCTIAILHYYEVINVPALELIQENDFDPDTGEPFLSKRLCATGLFSDPNDLSMIAVVGIIISLFGCGDTKLGMMRFAWIAPIAIFFPALLLTQSRGGLLAFIVGLGVFSYVRFGVKKTFGLALVVVPAVIATLGKRQASLGEGMSQGSGAQRLELWRDGLDILKTSPIFGIGFGNYVEEFRHVAHNSFVHCFVELGLFGGALFLGTVWFAGVALWKFGRMIRSRQHLPVSADFRRFYPYMVGILAAYSTSMYSLSRSYVVPTYLILGISNAYIVNGIRSGLPTPVVLNERSVRQLCFLSVGFLLFIHFWIRFQLH